MSGATFPAGTPVNVTTPISRTRAVVRVGVIVQGRVAGSDYYLVRLEGGAESVYSGDYIEAAA